MIQDGCTGIKSINELKILISMLKKYRGYATTLVTLYINGDRPIPDIVNMLREEWAVSGNIKDKTTRNHVQDAIDRIIGMLKGTPKAPPNGLVVFAGFHMISPGNYTWVSYVVIPPFKISTFKYICDMTFHTELLEEGANTTSTYGIIIVERGEAVIALLRGNYWEIVKKVQFFVPNKHSAGGQSALRYKRQTEHLAEVFYKMLADSANEIFLKINDLKGIIVSGPGPTKEDFLKEDALDYRLKDKVIAIVDACCPDEYGVIETIRKASEHIKDNEYVHAKELLETLMEYAVRKSNYVVFGRESTMKALKYGAARIILVSENVGEEEILNLVVEGDKKGIKVEVIPKAVEESKMLDETFGGYAAILQYPVTTLEAQDNQQ
ncbi:MAG: peptide chain release factor aRF-1 [Thermocladium sp.]|nr:MAG: peptide chain release factor 1 [Thermocladium sp. ECH_B]